MILNRSIRRTLLSALAAVALAATAAAQPTVPPDKDGLLNGEGMGMAAYAEMNGYPGPKHVLDLADKLGLSAKQKSDIREIYDDMLSRARATGKMVVRVEGELNDQFVHGGVKEENTTEDSETIGRLRGSLRAIHLGAHIRTKALLTTKQIETYMKLRAEQRAKDGAKH